MLGHSVNFKNSLIYLNNPFLNFVALISPKFGRVSRPTSLSIQNKLKSKTTLLIVDDWRIANVFSKFVIIRFIELWQQSGRNAFSPKMGRHRDFSAKSSKYLNCNNWKKTQKNYRAHHCQILRASWNHQSNYVGGPIQCRGPGWRPFWKFVASHWPSRALGVSNHHYHHLLFRSKDTVYM